MESPLHAHHRNIIDGAENHLASMSLPKQILIFITWWLLVNRFSKSSSYTPLQLIPGNSESYGMGIHLHFLSSPPANPDQSRKWYRSLDDALFCPKRNWQFRLSLHKSWKKQENCSMKRRLSIRWLEISFRFLFENLVNGTLLPTLKYQSLKRLCNGWMFWNFIYFSLVCLTYISIRLPFMRDINN